MLHGNGKACIQADQNAARLAGVGVQAGKASKQIHARVVGNVSFAWSTQSPVYYAAW